MSFYGLETGDPRESSASAVCHNRLPASSLSKENTPGKCIISDVACSRGFGGYLKTTVLRAIFFKKTTARAKLRFGMSLMMRQILKGL